MGALRVQLTPWAFDQALLGEPIAALVADGLVVDDPDGAAVADVASLRAVEATWLVTLQAEAVARGVRFVGEPPFLGPRVELAPGCTVWGGAHLLGRTTVAAGAVVQVGCHLKDSTVGPGAELKPYTVADHAEVGAGAVVGPFAHLRSGTVLDDDVKVGNFVETKKTHMQAGSKANHLSYLGDAFIGAKANIGAGTITCNYDGFAKHVTTIEAGAFIGSDTQLVAPVTVGRDAYIASGSTVTKDVPRGSLALSRVAQVNRDGWADRFREAQSKRKKSEGGGH